jgi:hypothetical protein
MDIFLLSLHMQQHKDPDQKIKDTKKKKNEKNRTELTVYFRARSSSFNSVVEAANEHEREPARKGKRTIEINIMRERTGSESTREKEKRRKN